MDERLTLTRYEFDVLTHCLPRPDSWYNYSVTRDNLVQDKVLHENYEKGLTPLGAKLYALGKQNPRALPHRL